jgi:hypothetical protein
MEKSFRPIQLYALKTFGLAFATIAAFVFIYLLYSLVTLSLPVYIAVIIHVLFGILLLVALLFIVLNFLRGKPTISISETFLKYKYRKILFENIKTYKPARGGSEPEIITKDEQSFTLELSWFKKSDRLEIDQHIKDHVS